MPLLFQCSIHPILPDSQAPQHGQFSSEDGVAGQPGPDATLLVSWETYFLALGCFQASPTPRNSSWAVEKVSSRVADRASLLDNPWRVVETLRDVRLSLLYVGDLRDPGFPCRALSSTILHTTNRRTITSPCLNTRQGDGCMSSPSN
jgi:hypothetical protein